jgi:hypothetical protein
MLKHLHRRSPRLRAGLSALLALPVLMAPGKCGFVLDYTETFLITDPVEHVVLGADDGSIVGTEYERSATMLKRHTFGFEPSLGTTDWSVADGVLTIEARCKYEGNCRFDHMFELPLGVSFEIAMNDAQVSLGYIGGDIELSLLTGWFRGVRLLSPNVSITLDEGDVDLDFAAPPETLAVDVRAGDVVVAVPAGSYRCVLVADAGSTNITGVTCDDAATAVLDVHVQTGDITVTGA